MRKLDETCRNSGNGDGHACDFARDTERPCPGAIGKDSFADATVMASLPFTDTIYTTGATTESSEPLPCGSMGSTVWYAYTPTSNEVIDVHTEGSGFDTVLAVYTGDGRDTILHISCNDDIHFGGAPRTWSRSVLDVTAGTTYYIQIGGKFADVGDLAITIESVERPANDDFANATVIATASFADELATPFASAEVSEPLWICAETDHTGWYTYTPDVNQTVSVFTAGATNFTTVQAIYDGDDLTLLEPISCATGWDHAIFGATAGTTYRVQIGGHGEQSGWLQAQLEAIPNEPPQMSRSWETKERGSRGRPSSATPMATPSHAQSRTRCHRTEARPSRRTVSPDRTRAKWISAESIPSPTR